MPLIDGAAAGAASAAAAAVGAGAFKYNRANYMFDQGLRFSRYTAGYNFAIEQASQYREDIRDMTALTVTKQDTYHSCGVIFFVLNFQLIMAGRLGVHGPSPPGWMMGLYWGNITSALMFLCVYTWLSLHASARATAGAAHMLTRNVRLPIPTPKQLDKARKTGNAFEKQRVSDVFRIPFVMPAPKERVPEDPEAGLDFKKSSKPVSNRRMPKWFQDEQRELYAGAGGPSPATGATPEHFELYRGLQQEWWAHDAYARIGMLYFMSCWLTSAALYTQCHCFGELRALWPAWSTAAVFSIAHRCILKIDISPEPCGRMGKILPAEQFIYFTPLVTALGMSLDYSIFPPSYALIGLVYACAWTAYAINFAWALRLYDLAEPVQQVEIQEVPGQPWWPQEWWLPQAFQNITYMVAPPKHLEPGQTCLQQEMKAVKGPRGLTVPVKKARDVGPQLFPWKIFRGAVSTCIAIWAFIIFGRIFEQIHGERQLLKQEGRVERWPSHIQPWMTPWTRLGTRNEWAHAGGSDRRLQAQGQAQEVASMANQLVSILGPLAEALDTKTKKAESALPHIPTRPSISWPTELKPSFFPSSEGLVAALDRFGNGALAAGAKALPLPFKLSGIEELGHLLGASWGQEGLMVATAHGSIAECSNAPVGGAWPCRQVGVHLPSGGSKITSAVVMRMPGTGVLRAALTFSEDAALAVFEMEAGREWVPVGEVELPHAEGQSAPTMSFSVNGDELTVDGAYGSSMKWDLNQDSRW